MDAYPSNPDHVGRILQELARYIYDRHLINAPPPIILLGAGASVASGCPTLHALVADLASKSGRTELVANPDALQDYLSSRSNSEELFTLLHSALTTGAPSPGYFYLASLVADGYLDLLITLNFDPHLDRALMFFSSSLPYVPRFDFLRLVRGEHTDSYIARALAFSPPRAKLLKLHGDLFGRSMALAEADTLRLERPLHDQLVNMINTRGIILIGTRADDLDLVNALGTQPARIWFINPEPPPENSQLAKLLRASKLREHVVTGTTALFDDVLPTIALRVRKLDVLSREATLRAAFNRQVRTEAEHLRLTDSQSVLGQLAQKILAIRTPYNRKILLTYIHDPAAPGGSEVRKRIAHKLLEHGDGAFIESEVVVTGAELRWVDRHVRATEGLPADATFDTIIVIDSISFTGNTLGLATQMLQKRFPGTRVVWAVLVASDELRGRLGEYGLADSDLLAVVETNRNEIFFPWGWTQPTARMMRPVRLYDSTAEVQFIQRPWGTIELLAENAICSVRLHTIRAGKRLSLQRHFQRDEFFVTLDDNVGVEFEDADGRVVEAALLPRGRYIVVPRGVKHRFAAHRDTVRLLEVGFGLYDQVRDIERYEDDYGRVGKRGDV